MTKKCDHTSVGMLVWDNQRLLLIEREKPPFGFAPPAGHVDGDDSFEQAARRELKEEVGLDTKDLTLLTEGRKENPCRRYGGQWHYWKIYRTNVSGKIKRSKSETKQAGFYTRNDLLLLAHKTQKYMRGDMSQKEWEQLPGLENAWYDWLQELKVIP